MRFCPQVSVAMSSNGSRILAAEGGGGLYISIDSGATWTVAEGAGSRNWVSGGEAEKGGALRAWGAPCLNFML